MILEELTEVYSQEPDSCSDESMIHIIKVEIVDAGGGPYIVLKTERWALDEEEIPHFVRQLRKALNRVKKSQKYAEVVQA